MLLFESNPRRIDLTSYARGIRSLADLGFTASNSDPGWYYDGDVYRQADADSFRFSCENGKCGLLVEGGKMNVALYSSENNAVWIDVTGSPTRASATSIMSGKTAIKITSSNVTHCIGQDIGTFAGDENFYVIVEQGTGTTCDIEIYDSTAAASIGKVRLTFSTGIASQITAGNITSYRSYKITNSGKNGGVIYAVFMTVQSTGGNNRQIRFYPSTSGAGYVYFHHAQLEESDSGSSPIVTTSSAGNRSNDVVIASASPSFLNGGSVSIKVRCEKVYSEIIALGAIFSFAQSSSDFIYLSEFSSDAMANAKIGGVDYSSTVSSILTSGSEHKICGSFSDGYTVCAADGSAGSDGNQVGMISDTMLISIGSLSGFFGWSGRIFEIIMINATLNAADMNAATT